MNQDLPFVWKSNCKKDLGGPKSWWGRASGNHQDEANSASDVDGVSDMALACRLCGFLILCGEGSEKEQWLLCREMEVVWLSHPGVWVAKGSSIPITLEGPDN